MKPCTGAPRPGGLAAQAELQAGSPQAPRCKAAPRTPVDAARPAAQWCRGGARAT